jgi:hypothetical protein
VRARLCKLQKVHSTRSRYGDKVYQLLAHGQWFSPGTPASSTIKDLIGEKHQPPPGLKKNSKMISLGKNISESKEEQQKDLLGKNISGPKEEQQNDLFCCSSLGPGADVFPQ